MRCCCFSFLSWWAAGSGSSMPCSSSAGSTTAWRRGGQIAHRRSRRRHDRRRTAGGGTFGARTHFTWRLLGSCPTGGCHAGEVEEAADGGGRSKQSLKGASREMVESMSERQLREFARTKRKGLPRKRGG